MTQTAQISNIQPATMPLHAAHVAPHIQAASHAFRAQAPMAEAMQRADRLASAQEAQAPDRSGVSGSVGSFIHHNKGWMTNYNPAGYAGYHWIRSAVACVPYGLMCGLVFAGNAQMRKWGALTEEVNGVKQALAPEKIHNGWATFTNSSFFESLAQSAMVATAFTLYRTTSFAGRRFYERTFNPENSERETIEELRKSPINFIDDLRKNFDIQSHSVPWAALSLGFIMVGGGLAADGIPLAKSKEAQKALAAANEVGKLKLLKPAGLVGLATVGYSAFFEIADQLGKRRRERAGIADPTKNINDIDLSRIEPGKVQDILDQPKSYGFFTDDSGMGRLLFRRALPVAAGVGSYVLLKPKAMRFAADVIGLNKGVEEAKAVAKMTEGIGFWKNSWIEGVGTSLFATYTVVKDPWERAYDNFFDKLERKANPEFYARKDELDKDGVELRVELRKKQPKQEAADEYALPTVPAAPAAAQIQTPALLEGKAKAASEALEK